MRGFVALAFVLALASPVQAQLVTDAGKDARLHFGPLDVTPRLALHDIGIDTNVFNQSLTPQKDLTTTLTTGANAWLRAGRGYFSSRTYADIVYFQKAASQRSFNINQEGRVDVDLIRFVPRAGFAFLNTRQRPNAEFDTRVQQRHVSAFGGVGIPVGLKGKLDAEFWQQTFDYSSGTFGDDEVAWALNRRSTATTMSASVELTPLTTLIMRTETRRDRFDYAVRRNSNSFRLMPGLQFRPDALISGTAFVGFRQFRTPSPTVPDFSGVVAAVELKFIAVDMFRIVGQVSRDVDYSLDLEDSFFISTTAGVEVTQAVGLFWDVVGRVRRSLLDYQKTIDAFGRTDRAWQTGVGIGRRIGTDIRAGVDVDYVTRHSVLRSRAFDGFKVGGSVTYGY